MLKITQGFLDDCDSLSFHPFYSEHSGMLADGARRNWWIEVGPGMARPAAWVNAERAPISRATAETLIAATVAQDGGLVLPGGGIADLDEELNIIPRS